MITNAKRILIETDSRETVVIRSHVAPLAVAHCEDCQLETEILDLNSAVTLSGRGARQLIREIEAGNVHSIQTPGGHLLICVNSLYGLETTSEIAKGVDHDE